jgi:general secretion pathway protein H
MRTTARNNDGYTLLELLVVLGILALIAAGAVPVASRAIESAMLNSDARAVMVELRRIANDATASQTTISLSENPDGGLSLSTGEDWAVPSGSTVRLRGRGGHIDFYPDGTSSGGLLDVGRNGDSIGVAVAWLSGDVEEERGP